MDVIFHNNSHSLDAKSLYNIKFSLVRYKQLPAKITTYTETVHQ